MPAHGPETTGPGTADIGIENQVIETIAGTGEPQDVEMRHQDPPLPYRPE